MTQDFEKYHVPNLLRALEILEFMAKNPKEYSSSELANQLSLPNNSVFRIAATLEGKGFLDKDPDSKKFRLSTKMLSLGYSALGELNIVAQALDILQDLRDATGETALLGIRTGNEGVVLEHVPSAHPVKFLVSPGTRFPLHTAAPGKVFLAYLPERTRNAIIEKMDFHQFRPNTIKNKDELLESLESTLKNGYAIDIAEELEGVHCIAAPVFNYTGNLAAAVWITGPAERLPQKDFKQLGTEAIKQATRLSKRLGHINS
jgi:DNA-binding IclR family transcriptional regulator